MGMRMRRMAVAVGVGLAVLGAAGLAMADGSLTITPPSGAPGTGYTVQVTCGELPEGLPVVGSIGTPCR